MKGNLKWEPGFCSSRASTLHRELGNPAFKAANPRVSFFNSAECSTQPLLPSSECGTFTSQSRPELFELLSLLLAGGLKRTAKSKLLGELRTQAIVQQPLVR